MARKKKESVKFDVNSEKSKEFVAPMDKFLRLSSLLFNDEDDECPYRMNDLKESNPFYSDARNMAKELEIDWDKMTSEDSNRIMLNLLGDAFMACKPAEGLGLHIKYEVRVETYEKKTKKDGGTNAEASE